MHRICTIAVLTLLTACSTHSKAQLPLTLTRTITLAGVSGKFDHFAIDEPGSRLFAAATGSHAIEVVDLNSGSIVQSLNGLGKPHGLAWVPKQGQLIVADGSKAELDVFAGSPLKLIKSIKLSDDADDMVYDPATSLIYVGHGGSDAANPGRIAVIDTKSLSLLADLPVKAHPEGLELDPVRDRIFANISDTGEVVIIDGKSHSITTTWSLASEKGNTPLAYDAEDNRLFVGCRTPAKLLLLDGEMGKEITSAPADAGADDLFYEPSTRREYLITGSGVVDRYKMDSEGKLQELAPTTTANGAKTGLLVPSSGELFVGVPGVGGAAEIRVYTTAAKATAGQR